MTFGILTLIAACGLLGPLLSGVTRLAVPVVVGEIVAGVIVGRTGFRWLDPATPTAIFLTAVGFAMLMFAVGTRLPLRDPGLRGALKRALVAAALSFAVAAPAGVVFAHQSGIPHTGVFMLLLAASSSAVVMPIVLERGLSGPQVLFATAWIAILDIATIVGLPLALEPSRALRVAGGGALVAAAAVIIFGAVHMIREEPAVVALRTYSRKRGWALDLRVSLVALFGLAALATRFDTSILVAGFATGIIVALAGEPRRLTEQLLGLAEGFFVPLFFVTLGARLDFRALASSRANVELMAALAAAIVACHVAVALVLRIPYAAGLLASAQLGLPAGVVALGLTDGVLTSGQGAAIIASATITLAVSSIGAALLQRSIPSVP
jgi:Kef-type K+ transport system membrane component KefB